MNIHPLSFPQATTFLEEHIARPLFHQNKRIMILAVAALALLAVCYIVRFGFFRAKPLNGEGKLVYPDGKVAIGNFINSQLDGKGTVIHPNGMKEEGTYKNNFFHGEGIITNAHDEVIVKGEFRFGKLHGHGYIHCPNGDVYEGEFEKNLLHGQGKIKQAKGIIKEGRFEHGLLHGKGKITGPGSRIEEGEFVHGVFKGTKPKAPKT